MDDILSPLVIHRKAFQFGELSFDSTPSDNCPCIAMLDNIVSDKDQMLAQLNWDTEQNSRSSVHFLKKNIISPNIHRASNLILNPVAVHERISPKFQKYDKSTQTKLADHFTSTWDIERLNSE